MTEYHADLDPEELEPCPYENAHMVRRKRMQYHLMKCRKNHPGKEFKTCPFNACHEMPGAEYRYHLATCPDKNTLEKDIAYAREKENGEGSQFKGCTDVPAYNSYELDCAENWDDDVNPNPRIGVHEEYLSKVKFKNITGLTPAEKRHFHRTLNPEHPEPASSVQVNKENEIPNGEGDGKLRLPKNTSKAFSMYQSQAPAPHQTQHPSTVFQYSLAQCGIGRGRAASALRNNEGPVGRGRGIGNLVQSGVMGPPAAQTVAGTSPGATNYNIPSTSSSLSSSSVVGVNHSTAAPFTNGFTGMTVPANVFPSQALSMPIGRGRGVGRASPSATNGFSLPPGVISNGQKTDTEWPSLTSTKVFSPASGIQSLQGSSPAYVVPKVSSEKISQSPQKKNWFEYSSSDSGSGADGSSDPVMDEGKKRKQVQKKLRQVMALEAKVKSGLKLNPDEEIKLSQKSTLEQQLAALSL